MTDVLDLLRSLRAALMECGNVVNGQPCWCRGHPRYCKSDLCCQRCTQAMRLLELERLQGLDIVNRLESIAISSEAQRDNPGYAADLHYALCKVNEEIVALAQELKGRTL